MSILLETRINILFVMLVMFSLFGCNDDEDTPTQDNATLFMEMQTALGGTQNINDATHLSFQSVGVASEFQEDPEPINEKVADFSYDLLYDLSGSNSRQSWSVQTDYAYESDFSFVETIDGTNGDSEGETGFFSQFFAGFGVEGDPMFSTKIGARQKTLFMSSPLAITKMIQTNGVSGSIFGTISVGYNISSLGYGNNTPDIELVIDQSKKLPTKAQTMELDPLFGDVLYEVVYGDWITVSGVQVPGKLTHILDGHIIRTETLSNHQINPTFNVDDLAVATPDWAYSQNQAMYGYLSSQFHYRTLMQTFAIDFPVEFTDQTSPLALPSEFVPNDNKVYRVSGDFQSHYTYAFEVDGGILLYDSPINNRRSETVLAKVRSHFSNLPIKYVVNSHNHFDHVGGIRGNLAEGGDLIVGAGSKAEFENILQRSHTILPNPIVDRTVTVTGVTDSLVIGTASEQVILYILPTHHAENEDFIIMYKPSTKTIYSNDVYNPGFINIYSSVGQANQERLVLLAKDLVDFVDARGLDVETSYCSHGFTTQDFDFDTVRMLASF